MHKEEHLKQLNKRSYEIIATDFDATRYKPWIEFEPVASKISDGDRILDIGCGNGRLLKALPNVNFQYTGIDSNEYLLKKAKKHNPGREFICQDMESLQLEPESYDFIFCIATFHHLVSKEDRLQFLEMCYRGLKRDGEMLFSVWRLWQPKYIQFMFKNMKDKVSWNDFFIPWRRRERTTWRYYHGFTKHELKKLFTEAGFFTKFLQSSKDGQLSDRGYNIVIHAKK